MIWQFKNTGVNDGQTNMDIDIQYACKVEESLLKSKSEQLAFLRVYSWNKPTLSLGKNQQISEINIDECEKRSIPIVRRPTGGRAVLHANELTYCVTMPCADTTEAQSAYKAVHQFICNVLEPLNIPNLEFQKSQPNFHKHYSQSISGACFSASARYELTSNNKKLVGSAQRVHNGVLLQHGSLLLDNSHLQITELMTGSPEKADEARILLEKSSISLSECVTKQYTFEDIAELFRTTFNKNKGIPLS